MTKWQEYYLRNIFYGNRVGLTRPKLEVLELELKLLEGVGDTVTVHFPEFKSDITSLCKPAHVETYTITPDYDDMPNGFISVVTLISNLALWSNRGYQIDK